MRPFTRVTQCLTTLFFAFCASFAVAQSGAERADKDVVVMSHWSVKLPFSLDENDPLMVGDVLDPMWAWITPGQRITTVNGIEIGNLNAVRAVLRMSTELTNQRQIMVQFGTEVDGDVVYEVAVLPIIQDTVLKNGMHFETVFTGESWVSTLVARPDTAVTDMQVGDSLISYKDQSFDTRKSVQQAFQKERRKGMMSYEVVFARDGVVETGMIELSDDAVEKDDMSNLVVLSQWNVEMPMVSDPQSPARVSRVEGRTSINEGDMIVSVNGINVGNINALSPVLRLSTEIDDETELSVALGVQTANSDEVAETQITLPIVQDTVLGNGMRFETKYAKHSWETHLVSMPEGANTDLKVGDRILAYGNGAPVNARTSIKDVIEADRRKGMRDYEVIVLRDGGFMNCKLVY